MLGLYYCRARILSPQLGRFLERDPTGYKQGTNLYAYAENNPLVFTGTSGTDSRVLEPGSHVNSMLRCMNIRVVRNRGPSPLTTT